MASDETVARERTTRRAPRVADPADRANAILDAAVVVFARKGYPRATTKEIAAEAGVAEGTIFNYFRSKRELLFALLKRLATETLPAVLEQPVADQRDLVAMLIRDRFAMLEKGGPLVQVVLQELASDAELRQAFFVEVILPLMAMAGPVFQERINRGEVRPVNPRVVFPAIVGAVMLSALAFEMANRVELPLPGPPIDREGLIAGLVDFIMYGLAGQHRLAADTIGGAQP